MVSYTNLIATTSTIVDKMPLGNCLLEIYDKLNEHFGDLHWWPGEDPFEIAVGAILTQNTSWGNVEIAINRLKSKGLLSASKLFETEDNAIAKLIKSSGFYNVKTKILRAFLKFLYNEHNGSIKNMLEGETWKLREELLKVKGVGEETADSILLYACNKPVFVVDAYTRRILERHNIIDKSWEYKDIQELFMKHIPLDVRLYNQFHALLVNTGKYYCRKRSLCDKCPINGLQFQP